MFSSLPKLYAFEAILSSFPGRVWERVVNRRRGGQQKRLCSPDLMYGNYIGSRSVGIRNLNKTIGASYCSLINTWNVLNEFRWAYGESIDYTWASTNGASHSKDAGLFVCIIFGYVSSMTSIIAFDSLDLESVQPTYHRTNIFILKMATNRMHMLLDGRVIVNGLSLNLEAKAGMQGMQFYMPSIIIIILWV